MFRRKNSIHFYVIILLVAIASLELVPNALVLLCPDLSSTLFSSGRTATTYRWAYRTIGMSHICFMAYNIALLYLMILVVSSVHFSLITKPSLTKEWIDVRKTVGCKYTNERIILLPDYFKMLFKITQFRVR